MNKCDNCRLRKESAKAFDIHWHGEDDCPYDKCPVPDFPKTNANKIRAMSDEELAHTLWRTAKGGIIRQRSETEWLTWLKREAET